MDFERHFKYELFIGGSNVTGKVDVDRIISICSEYFNSFTGVKGSGVYHGEREECYIVTFVWADSQFPERTVTRERLKAVVELLKKDLYQERILITCQEIKAILY